MQRRCHGRVTAPVCLWWQAAGHGLCSIRSKAKAINFRASGTASQKEDQKLTPDKQMLRVAWMMAAVENARPLFIE